MRTESGLVVYEVSEFIQYLNDTLYTIVDTQRMCVEGEVSSFNVSQQKWVRFDLKDPEGVINCFLVIMNLHVPLEDGMKICVYGYPKIYPKYGKLSITVQKIELVGEGALKRAYELLKKRLETDGYFDPSRKRTVPRFPQTIGLITSREAAACGDFLRILRNRWGGVTVRLASVQVQGGPSIKQIVGAFQYFNTVENPPDVLVLTRGGGSLEDLAAFNSEEVARAIFSSRIPVVVGVGHERDETIADFVADVRASTPTNAAEIVVPDRRDVGYVVRSSTNQMMRAMQQTQDMYSESVRRSVNRLETYVRRSLHSVVSSVLRFRGAFREYRMRLRGQIREVQVADVRLVSFMMRCTQRISNKVDTHERLLKSFDPKAVLARGYSIVFDKKKGIVRSSDDVATNDKLTVQLARGTIQVFVQKETEQERQTFQEKLI